jgi:hypothetical protein
MADETMKTPSEGTERANPSSPRRRVALRPWLRTLHRDFGYLLVGLTFVYALSGLAVNHVADWDPNFIEREETIDLGSHLPVDDDALAARRVASAAHLRKPVDAVDRISDEELEVRAGDTTVTADLPKGVLLVRERRARPLLRLANWLHLNRGKKAWTIIADGYAILLLFLATSGMFMLPGRKGLIGRGAILVLAGIVVPVGYVVLSGGP